MPPTGGADGSVRYWARPHSLQQAGGAAGAKAAAAAAAKQPYTAAGTHATKATPVSALAFTRSNLLLGAGALTLPVMARS